MKNLLFYNNVHITLFWNDIFNKQKSINKLAASVENRYDQQIRVRMIDLKKEI